ncbi:hypothetical protein G7051_05620 [Dysgonomonas sp. HDW5B]|uniref:hypothetical protein n=1 Tax=Dysgonomonas sp. HDW5B TaxID=2714927 RepID=UPI00140C2D29|nr:hypothetical protein [Dysgonomonas sp. HDW5B]QIK53846.1 hypothetical protein G7051_05620 [Dysgonomonas sp. HDW5B]
MPVRLLTLAVARGTRRANESVKKQKDINDKCFSFVLAFEPVAGRAKGTVLIFCFVLHQGKMKNKPKGCVRKIGVIDKYYPFDKVKNIGDFT